MKRNLWMAAALIGLLPAMAVAQPEQGKWTLELSGSGFNDTDFENGLGSLSVEVGKFLTDRVQVGVRQDFSYTSVAGSSQWGARTRIFVDYHFDMDKLQPFVGASVGVDYGEDVDARGIAGPEVGVKYYVLSDTYIFALAEYQFFFTGDEELENVAEDGQFVYSLGIGFAF